MAVAGTELASPASAGARQRPRRIGGRLSAGHVIMIVAALLAVLLNYSVLRARDDTVRVAVAAEDLRAGAALDPGRLRFAEVRVDESLQATLLDPDGLSGVRGWIAVSPIAAGELVRRGDLRAPSAPAEQRAMSIPVEPAHAVGGALDPGDRVDVIAVADDTAAYVVTGAEVLAVAGLEAAAGLGAPRTFSVTVGVDDHSALRLALAIRRGGVEVVRATGARAAEATAFPLAADAPAAEGR